MFRSSVTLVWRRVCGVTSLKPHRSTVARKDMDDFLIDEIKNKRGQYGLDFDLIDEMLDQAIARARKLAAQ